MADAGDDWAAWFDRLGPARLLLARSWVATRPDAEDVVQEAFVRFWPARRRAALDWVRTGGLRARREAATARPEGEPLFDGPAERAERRTAVAVALEALPEAQREVLVMKVWGGLTFPQIAAALDIPADTATSRFRYARDKLRTLLSEEAIP